MRIYGEIRGNYFSMGDLRAVLVRRAKSPGLKPLDSIVHIQGAEAPAPSERAKTGVIAESVYRSGLQPLGGLAGSVHGATPHAGIGRTFGALQASAKAKTSARTRTKQKQEPRLAGFAFYIPPIA